MGPGAGIHGGKIVAEGTPADIMATPAFAHRAISHRQAHDRYSGAASRQCARVLRVVDARGNNLKNVTADIPLGLFTCITGVSGGGKSTLTDRDALQGGRPQAQQCDARPLPRTIASKVWSTSTRSSTSTSRRSAARRARTRRPTPARSRRSATGSPACRKRKRPRLRAGPFLLQRQGRPLRGLPGRRRHQDRDALPAGRLRHLRRLQGQALQPRDAGGAVQGQVDRRRARHDGRGSVGVLQGGAARSASRWRCSIASASATSTSASRRRRSRAAKRSASSSPRSCRGGRPDAPSTSSTSRPPACTSTT